VTPLRHALHRLRGFVAARVDTKTKLGLYLTIVLLLGAAAVWIFGAVLDAVLDNATMVRLDMSLDAAIHNRVTPGGLSFFSAVTHLADPLTNAALAVIGAVALWIARHRGTLVTWIAAFAGSAVLNWVLKLAVHRHRPAYGAAYLHGDSFSFPSGHSMGIVIAVGMLLYVGGLYWHPPRWVRRSCIALGGLVILLIGVSRVYLGVHYPSDVLGGYAAATGWLAACISADTVARSRRVR